MELILNGIFTGDCHEKTVELNGAPVKCIVAILDTKEDRLPITAWGDKKVGYVKEAMSSGQQVKIVAHLQAKPQTYTNHEGETVTVPNMQLKLFSFVGGVPKANNYSAPDPTGSFVSATPEQKAEYLAPFNPYKTANASPWRGNMEGAL